MGASLLENTDDDKSEIVQDERFHSDSPSDRQSDNGRGEAPPVPAPFAPPANPHPITLQDRIRALTGAVVDALGRWLGRRGIHPDAITVAGALLSVIGAVVIGMGAFQVAGVLLLVGLPFDALDGAVARARGRTTQVGGVLDSTLDRVIDAAIFAGFAYYFAAHDALNYMLLALTALIGSFVVSYVRARAGEAGLTVRVGWLDRLLRLALIVLALLLPPLLIPLLWVLALGSWLTVGQRLWYVYSHLD